MADEGVDPATVVFRYGVSARYIGEIESFETALNSGQMGGRPDIVAMIEAFEAMYAKV